MRKLLFLLGFLVVIGCTPSEKPLPSPPGAMPMKGAHMPLAGYTIYRRQLQSADDMRTIAKFYNEKLPAEWTRNVNEDFAYWHSANMKLNEQMDGRPVDPSKPGQMVIAQYGGDRVMIRLIKSKPAK